MCHSALEISDLIGLLQDADETAIQDEFCKEVLQKNTFFLNFFFYVHILFQLADFSSTKAFDFFFSSHFQNLQVKRLGSDFWVKCLFVSSVGENYSKKKKVLHYRLLF